MLLSQKSILESFKKGDIFYISPKGFKIEEFCKNQSVDLHIGSHLYFPEKEIWITLSDFPNGFEIKKGEFFLAYTEEFIGTVKGSNLHPQFYLRSTLARNGLGCSKAGWGDVGYHNRWCITLYSCLPITVKEFDRIGQLSFTQTTLDSNISYTNQTGTYQQYEKDLVLNWRKESILPN
jgi:deoxycytidine triphosphate deaminase